MKKRNFKIVCMMIAVMMMLSVVTPVSAYGGIAPITPIMPTSPICDDGCTDHNNEGIGLIGIEPTNAIICFLVGHHLPYDVTWVENLSNNNWCSYRVTTSTTYCGRGSCSWMIVHAPVISNQVAHNRVNGKCTRSGCPW
jgi:hypothetical protein